MLTSLHSYSFKSRQFNIYGMHIKNSAWRPYKKLVLLITGKYSAVFAPFLNS